MSFLRNNDGAASPTAGAVRNAEPSVRQLRLFLTLAEELHFGKAAQRMFVTQSALSQQVKALEERLGICLVHRDTRSVELTPAGEALLPAIRAAHESMSRLRQLADEHHRQLSGHLVLGIILAESAQPYTQAMLAELRRQRPEISVGIRTLSFAGQFRSVANGDVDAAVLLQPIPPSLRWQHLATVPRVAVLQAGDPLVEDGAPPLTLTRLAHRTFIDIRPDADGDRQNSWSVRPRADGTVRYGPVVDDVEALFDAVARGQGIAFLPAIARHLYPRPGIAYADVTDLCLASSALAWASRNRSRPLLAALRDAARTVASARLADKKRLLIF